VIGSLRLGPRRTGRAPVILRTVRPAPIRSRLLLTTRLIEPRTAGTAFVRRATGSRPCVFKPALPVLLAVLFLVLHRLAIVVLRRSKARAFRTGRAATEARTLVAAPGARPSGLIIVRPAASIVPTGTEIVATGPRERLARSRTGTKPTSRPEITVGCAALSAFGTAPSTATGELARALIAARTATPFTALPSAALERHPGPILSLRPATVGAGSEWLPRAAALIGPLACEWILIAAAGAPALGARAVWFAIAALAIVIHGGRRGIGRRALGLRY